MSLLHAMKTAVALYRQRPNERVQLETAALLAEIAAKGDPAKIAAIVLPEWHPDEIVLTTRLRGRKFAHAIARINAEQEVPSTRLRLIALMLYNWTQSDDELIRVPSESAMRLHKGRLMKIAQKLERETYQWARELYDHANNGFDRLAYAQLTLLVFGDATRPVPTFWLATGHRLPNFEEWNKVMWRYNGTTPLNQLVHPDWTAVQVAQKAGNALRDRDLDLAMLCLAFADGPDHWVKTHMGETYAALERLVTELRLEQGLFQGSGNTVIRED